MFVLQNVANCIPSMFNAQGFTNHHHPHRSRLSFAVLTHVSQVSIFSRWIQFELVFMGLELHYMR